MFGTELSIPKRRQRPAHFRDGTIRAIVAAGSAISPTSTISPGISPFQLKMVRLASEPRRTRLLLFGQLDGSGCANITCATAGLVDPLEAHAARPRAALPLIGTALSARSH